MKARRQRCPNISGTRKRESQAWQIERARRLHRQFLRVEAATQSGRSIRSAIKQFARYWRGRFYRSSQQRKVRFSPVTLYRLYFRWRACGRSPEAIKLHYRSGLRRAPQVLLVRFVEHCSIPRGLALLPTWNAFAASQTAPPPVTYSAILRYFSSAQYRAIQRQLRIAATAERTAHRLVAEARAAIQASYCRKEGSQL